MAAIATDLRNVLIVGISAVIAAILLISGYRTRTSVVPAFVVIRHFCPPSSDSDFASSKNGPRRLQRRHASFL
jgi:hypothetical protein